jgi:hypothetical protein
LRSIWSAALLAVWAPAPKAIPGAPPPLPLPIQKADPVLFLGIPPRAIVDPSEMRGWRDWSKPRLDMPARSAAEPSKAESKDRRCNAPPPSTPPRSRAAAADAAANCALAPP